MWFLLWFLPISPLCCADGLLDRWSRWGLHQRQDCRRRPRQIRCRGCQRSKSFFQNFRCFICFCFPFYYLCWFVDIFFYLHSLPFQSHNLPKAEILECNPPKFEKEEDMSNLSILNKWVNDMTYHNKTCLTCPFWTSRIALYFIWVHTRKIPTGTSAYF